MERLVNILMAIVKAVCIPIFILVGFLCMIYDWITSKNSKEDEPIEVIEETSCPIARKLDTLEKQVVIRLIDKN